MNHSPTPWAIKGDDVVDDEDCYVIEDATAEPMDLAHIVHCVNLHEELVAELRRSLQWLASYPGGGAAEQWERVVKVLARVDNQGRTS